MARLAATSQLSLWLTLEHELPHEANPVAPTTRDPDGSFQLVAHRFRPRGGLSDLSTRNLMRNFATDSWPGHCYQLEPDQ